MNVDPIVITGIGLVTSLGLTAEQTWQGVLTGRASIGPMPALETPAPDGKGGYQAPGLPDDFAAGLPREIRYLRWTISAALRQANALESSPYEPRRCGFVLGTTLHGMRAGGQFLRTNDYAHLSSFLAGSVLQQATDGFQLRGGLMTTCSACSSSLGSIALAATLLETLQLDLVVAGGYDAVSEYAYGGFNSLRLVANGSLRSFARNRQGMKLGEGYGIIVLERASDATKRGTKPIAVVAGWGESADAHHLTQPHPKGEGAAAAITAAMKQAAVAPADIDLVAAHATGTPDNDAGEYAALATVFGEQLPKVPVVAFKTHVGHTLGGAGAVELILSAMALRDQVVPACANVTAEDVEFPSLALSTGGPKKANLRTTLNTSLGFGGANTCVILSAELPVIESTIEVRDKQEVCITGIGIVLPGMVGMEAFAERLAQPKPTLDRDTGPVPEDQFIHLLNARRVRRMSDYVKLSLAATTLACREAGFTEASPLPSDTSVLLGSTHGSSSYCVDYYRNIVTGGFVAANPLLFAEGVPNAAAAHLSLMLSLKGACQTVIGSRTSGLDALRLASLRIASGHWDRAVVGAAEEYLPLINEGYRQCGLYSPNGVGGFVTGAGAVSLILESREAVTRRGGKSLGTIGRSASSRVNEGDGIDAIRSVLTAIGRPDRVIGSANNTWIDRAESAAAHLEMPGTCVDSIYGYLPELFSVGPLAAVAASLVKRANGILCMGYDGVVSSVELERVGQNDSVIS
jgi:3-oxoacyl-[acyl-carrier-protein] synthase II